MSPPVLVDSSVYIAVSRQGLDPAEELTRAVSLTDLVICGIVRLEVLRGVRLENHRTRLASFMDVLQNVPTDNRMWQEAADLAWKMDRDGWVIPAQDILIACCAMRIGASVLTRDRHFARIPGLRVRSWPD